MDTSHPAYVPHGLDRGLMPVTGKASDYPSDHRMPEHSHPTAQLIHAVRGVMVVSTSAGQWVVPPTRGLWMPAGVAHRIRMVGDVQVRTVYIRPDALPQLPAQCQVVGISPLLRELILAAIEVALPYAPDSRGGRLMSLLLDEVAVLPSLPLRLPQPPGQGGQHRGRHPDRVGGHVVARPEPDRLDAVLAAHRRALARMKEEGCI